MKNMHIAALMEAVRNPVHCDKRTIHDQLSPVAEMVIRLQQQIGIYRGHMTRAELSTHDHALDGKIEMLHQTLNSLEAEAAEIFSRLRRLAGSATQWERQMAEAERDIENYEAGPGVVTGTAGEKSRGAIA